ncbi:MAG: hypothetical protein AAF125_19030, partial [Chloroflexota bacterium]
DLAILRLEDQIRHQYRAADIYDYLSIYRSILVFDGADMYADEILDLVSRVNNQCLVIVTLRSHDDAALKMDAGLYLPLSGFTSQQSQLLVQSVIDRDGLLLHPDMVFQYAREELGLTEQEMRVPGVLINLARSSFEPAENHISRVDQHDRSPLDMLWYQRDNTEDRAKRFLLRVLDTANTQERSVYYDESIVWISHASRQGVLEQVVQVIVADAEDVLSFPFGIDWVEHLIAALPPSNPHRLRLMRSFWRYGVSGDHTAFWQQLLEETLAGIEDLDLRIGLCEIYLQRNNGVDLDPMLHRLIQECGEQGQFGIQAEALYVLSRQLHRKGLISRSLRVIDRILPSGYASPELKHRVVGQRIRVLIDARQIEEVKSMLDANEDRWPVETCEVLFLGGQIDECLARCKKMIDALNIEPHAIRRLHLLVAQCHAKLGDFEAARDSFDVGLQGYAVDSWSVVPARAATNLAMLFYEMERLDWAFHLLRWAKQVQAAMGDRIGLLITERNLAHLRAQGHSI